MIEKPKKVKFNSVTMHEISCVCSECTNLGAYANGFNIACDEWEKWIKERLLTVEDILKISLKTCEKCRAFSVCGVSDGNLCKDIAQIIAKAQAKKMEGK